MKKKLLPIISHEELKEQEVEKKIDFETCPYCGSPTMRINLCVGERGYVRRGYYRSAYDSAQFICGFCGSTSPKVYLTPDLIDIEKVKQCIIKEYIDCDCDEDEEEENDDE